MTSFMGTAALMRRTLITVCSGLCARSMPVSQPLAMARSMPLRYSSGLPLASGNGRLISSNMNASVLNGLRSAKSN